MVEVKRIGTVRGVGVYQIIEFDHIDSEAPYSAREYAQMATPEYDFYIITKASRKHSVRPIHITNPTQLNRREKQMLTHGTCTTLNAIRLLDKVCRHIKRLEREEKKEAI